jgi:hypothetical protein
MAKKKRTSITVPSKTKKQLEYLANRYSETLGSSLETMTDYVLTKIVKGDYDNLEPDKLESTELIYGSLELKRQADVKAKELGFKGTKDMLEKVVRDEHYAHTRKATEKEAIAKFTKVGNADDEKDE